MCRLPVNITAVTGLADLEELPEEVDNLIDELHKSALLMADTSAGACSFVCFIKNSVAIVTLAVAVRVIVTDGRNYCLACFFSAD